MQTHHADDHMNSTSYVPVDAKVPVPKDKHRAKKPPVGTVPLSATTAGNPKLPATAVIKDTNRSRETKRANGLS